MSEVSERLDSALSGRYAVEREIGAGGMATVYLARDLKHDRRVALKVLKPELAAVVGAERFLAEIRTTANLQHPHILPLFDSGQAGGFLYYVMPYVEGESLRERLDRERQLAIPEALRITSALGEALDYAHERGVVHRDIKPANVLLSRGQPLLADFGIALAISNAGSGRVTETGLSLGTPHYMSPEQATGDQSLGPQTDVYSLGCVLYEMLVGEPPYLGNTAQAVLGKIIAGEPVSAAERRRSVPANVDSAIRCALERVPADRFSSGRDLARALADPAFRHGEPISAPAERDRVVRRRWSFAAAAVVLLLVLATGARSLLRADPPAALTQYVLSTDGWAGLGTEVGRYMAIAPDGSSLVLPMGDQLGLKLRGSTDIVPIPGTEGAREVVYSPDGEWIAYAVGTNVLKRPLSGGAPVTLAENAEEPPARVGLTWLDDGTVLYESAGNEVIRIPEEGGGGLDTISGVGPLIWLEGLPGGRGALAVNTAHDLIAIDLRGATSHRIQVDVLRAWYARTGHVVYVRTDGAVFAAPFDSEDLAVTEAPIPLFSGVRVTPERADMRVGADGSALYVKGAAAGAEAQREFIWVSREGEPTPVSQGERFVWSSNGPNLGLRLSPDGSRVAFVSATGSNLDIWTKTLPNGPMSRLTSEEGAEQLPAWSADGRMVSFASQRDSDPLVPASRAWRLWRQPFNGTGEAELVFGSPAFPVGEGIWSPDGKWIVVRRNPPADTASFDVLAIRVGADSAAVPVAAGRFSEVYPALSRDGRWIAYSSNETGRPEVFVRPFPDVSGDKKQISSTGGVEPVWGHSGRELFFVQPNSLEIMSASFTATAEEFQPGTVTALFTAPAGSLSFVTTRARHFDIAPGDKRFLMTRPVRESREAVESSSLVLVENLFAALQPQ